MRIAPALLLLALLAGPVLADSWMAPQPKDALSPDGAWMVSMALPNGWGKATYELVRRAESGRDVVSKTQGHVPMELRCLDGGRGFVLFENYGAIGMAISLSRYDGKGRRLWALRLNDLFSESRMQSFTRSVSSIWWYEGIWVDEANERVVVVPVDRKLLQVSLDEGKVSDAAPEVLLGCLERSTEEEKILGLETASTTKVNGLLEVAQKAYAGPGLSAAVRLRLAVILARHGDDSGRELVRAMSAKGTKKEHRRYAVEHLPDVLGTDAIPLLREAMRGDADDAWHAAKMGLVSLGAEAVPTLVEMVLEDGESSDYRGGAAHALGRLGDEAKPAVPALLRAAAEAPEYVANAALNTLIALVPADELGPKLVPILAAGSGDDGRIALFFQEHPRQDAVPALEAALRRHEEETTREWITDALAACRAR